MCARRAQGNGRVDHGWPEPPGAPVDRLPAGNGGALMAMVDFRTSERVTATEWIDGVKYRIVLEKDYRGRYHEVSFTAVSPGPRRLETEPVRLSHPRETDSSCFLG